MPKSRSMTAERAQVFISIITSFFLVFPRAFCQWFKNPNHSYRRATMGSTFAARFAGK
jgi:hypothetical protein